MDKEMMTSNPGKKICVAFMADFFVGNVLVVFVLDSKVCERIQRYSVLFLLCFL